MSDPESSQWGLKLQRPWFPAVSAHSLPAVWIIRAVSGQQSLSLLLKDTKRSASRKAFVTTRFIGSDYSYIPADDDD
jgi:hypothetical protein